MREKASGDLETALSAWQDQQQTYSQFMDEISSAVNEGKAEETRQAHRQIEGGRRTNWGQGQRDGRNGGTLS